MVFFVRMVTCNSDKVFLKPMTMKQYIEYVNEKIRTEIPRDLEIGERRYRRVKSDFANYIDDETYLSDMENVENYIKGVLTFEFYPIPANNYKSKSVWINTKNLEKYRI